MIRRPPRSTLFPYTDALPICRRVALPVPADHRLPPPQRLRQARRRVADRARPPAPRQAGRPTRRERSEEHTSELQSRQYLVCRLLLEKKNNPSLHISPSCTIL